MTVQLWQGSTLKGTLTLSGSNVNYSFENLPAGDYQLTVSKPGHTPRTQALTVSDQAVTQDLKLCMLGDVGGDGLVNMGDFARLYAHIKQTASLSDPYVLMCADVTGDGMVNMGDIGRLYAMIRG